jgi:hypothetical protein
VLYILIFIFLVSNIGQNLSQYCLTFRLSRHTANGVPRDDYRLYQGGRQLNFQKCHTASHDTRVSNVIYDHPSTDFHQNSQMFNTIAYVSLITTSPQILKVTSLSTPSRRIGEDRGMAPLIRIPCTRRTFQLLYLRRRTLVTLEWEAQRALNPLALLRFEPRIVQPVAWSLH